MKPLRFDDQRAMRERGLSIIELMVGIAVGLIVVTGIAKLFADYVSGTKRQMLEIRVNQELRAAADLVARDIRRAGYWDNAVAGVWGTNSLTVAANPYMSSSAASASARTPMLLDAAGAPTPAASAASSVAFAGITFAYAKDTNDVLNTNEYNGYRLQLIGGINVIQAQDGEGNWQAVTDPGTIRITTFTVNSLAPGSIDLSNYCACLKTLKCTISSIAAAGAPKLQIFTFKINIIGEAVAAPEISRSVQETVRVRNTQLQGSCPAA